MIYTIYMDKPNRKLIYIWKSNLEFYDSLPNKSEVFNKHLQELQKEKQSKEKTDFEKRMERFNGHQRTNKKD